jgi:hypothetical protein
LRQETAPSDHSRRDERGVGGRTVDDFDDQWSRYPDSTGFYGSKELFEDINHPFLKQARSSRQGKRYLVIYDQLKPAHAKYYTHAEALSLMRRAGFSDIQAHHRRGYSWTVIGTRPE